jgi:hypothetical protein
MTFAEATEFAKALTFIAAVWIAGAVLLVAAFALTFFAARLLIDLILDVVPWLPLALLRGGE